MLIFRIRFTKPNRKVQEAKLEAGLILNMLKTKVLTNVNINTLFEGKGNTPIYSHRRGKLIHISVVNNNGGRWEIGDCRCHRRQQQKALCFGCGSIGQDLEVYIYFIANN